MKLLDLVLGVMKIENCEHVEIKKDEKGLLVVIPKNNPKNEYYFVYRADKD